VNPVTVAGRIPPARVDPTPAGDQTEARKVGRWPTPCRAVLVVNALALAVQRRLAGEGLLAHSDRGSQYSSDHSQRLLARHGGFHVAKAVPMASLICGGTGQAEAATAMRTNEELIAAVLSGEQAAFAELLRRFERAAWTTAWKILRDYHAAQDATQNAFVEAYRRLGQLRSPDLFGVWLLRITGREALRLARQRRKVDSLASAGDFAASQAGDPLTPEASDLLLAIGRLPEHERLVIVLRYLDGLTVAEVARLTGRPVGTVTKQLSRAIERLRSMFREVKP
jgi:RNA polymerase sigma-70 factor (ECF subfamily)